MLLSASSLSMTQMFNIKPQCVTRVWLQVIIIFIIDHFVINNLECHTYMSRARKREQQQMITSQNLEPANDLYLYLK